MVITTKAGKVVSSKIMAKFIYASIISIGIFSCTYNNLANHLIDGIWVVISFENLATGVIEYRTQENSWNKEIVVAFDDTRTPKTISGTTISNEISGEFIYVNQDQFKVTKLESTQIYQPRWADEFVKAIADENLTFKITDDRLVIYYANASKKVTLQRR
jgi:choline kinase